MAKSRQNPRFAKPATRRPRRRDTIAAPVEEFRQLYTDGLSTRQIASLTGWSYTYIGRWVKDIARDRTTAARLRQPPTSKHWRSARCAARRLTEYELGRKLESWEHVHHKNGDYTDQRPENREVLSARDHAHVHHPPNPVPRHLRPDRRAYMKKYFETYQRGSRAVKAES